MTNYARGIAKERAFVQLMLERGCAYAYRTAGSHSLFDVIAIGADAQVFLTQIKRTKLKGKAHYLNALACLHLENFAESINYRDHKHITVTWAVWVDRDKWYEYTLYCANLSPYAGGRLATNHITREYWAHRDGWLWVGEDGVVWKVVEGVVMEDNNAWKVLPARRIQDPR